MPPHETHLEKKLRQLGLSQDAHQVATATKSKVQFRLYFPRPPYGDVEYRAARWHTGYNFVGALLGVGGTTLQRIQRQTGAKVEIHSQHGNLNGAHPDNDTMELFAIIQADSTAKLEQVVKMVADVLKPANRSFEPITVRAGGSGLLKPAGPVIYDAPDMVAAAAPPASALKPAPPAVVAAPKLLPSVAAAKQKALASSKGMGGGSDAKVQVDVRGYATSSDCGSAKQSPRTSDTEDGAAPAPDIQDFLPVGSGNNRLALGALQTGAWAGVNRARGQAPATPTSAQGRQGVLAHAPPTIAATARSNRGPPAQQAPTLGAPLQRRDQQPRDQQQPQQPQQHQLQLQPQPPPQQQLHTPSPQPILGANTVFSQGWSTWSTAPSPVYDSLTQATPVAVEQMTQLPAGNGLLGGLTMSPASAFASHVGNGLDSFRQPLYTEFLETPPVRAARPPHLPDLTPTPQLLLNGHSPMASSGFNVNTSAASMMFSSPFTLSYDQRQQPHQYQPQPQDWSQHNQAHFAADAPQAPSSGLFGVQANLSQPFQVTNHHLGQQQHTRAKVDNQQLRSPLVPLTADHDHHEVASDAGDDVIALLDLLKVPLA